MHMSKKFKQLREAKNIKKADLANALNVDYRTITNWEKENGIIPTLNTAKEIAQVFNVPTFDIYDSFINNPDEIEERLIQAEIFDYSQELDDVPVDDTSFAFFEYLAKSPAWGTTWGSGIIQYETQIFKFETLFVIDRFNDYLGDFVENGEAKKVGDFTLIPVQPTDKESFLDVTKHLYGGFIAVDNYKNIIDINQNNLLRWKLISKSNGNITFQLDVSYPLFPEMCEQIEHTGVASINLTFFDYKTNAVLKSETAINNCLYKSNYSFNQKNIIGKFIREIRKKHNMNQLEFADAIIGYETSNKTINKWEKGISLLSLLQLDALSHSYNFSAKSLLDQYDRDYFVEASIDNTNRVYNVGLNCLFSKSNTATQWFEFLRHYVYIKKFTGAWLDNSEVLGEITSETNEKQPFNADGTIINDIIVEDNQITIRLENDTQVILCADAIYSIETRNCYGNIVYESIVTYTENNICKKIRINLSLFATK